MILHVFEFRIHVPDTSVFGGGPRWNWEWMEDTSDWFDNNEPRGVLVTVPGVDKPSELGFGNVRRIVDVVGEATGGEP